MSQLSLAFDASLMIRDEQGRYLPATAEQILDAARKVIDQKVQRGAAFTSSELVKGYLIAKLGGFEHEVFSALFLDAKHRLIQYVEMFRGTIDSASVYPREVVKEALHLNAAAVIFAHNHPSGNPEPSQADKVLTQRLKEAWRWSMSARWITSSWLANARCLSLSLGCFESRGLSPLFAAVFQACAACSAGSSSLETRF